MTESQAWDALGAAVARIVELEKNREAEWWSIGDEVTRLLEGPAAKLLPFTGPGEIFASTPVTTPYSDLARYAEARRATNSDEGRRFPASNIAIFQEYEKAVGGRHEPGTLTDQVVEVPEPDGGVKRKRFADCSQEEIQAAIRGKLQPKPAPSAPPAAVSAPPTPTPAKVASPAAPKLENWGKPVGTPLPAESPEKLFAAADAEEDSHPQDAEAKLRHVIEMAKFGTDLHDRAYALLKRLEHSRRK
jgi:hypothetical protein